MMQKKTKHDFVMTIHICKFYSVSCINFFYIGTISNIHNMLYIYIYIYYEFKEKQ